MAAIAEHAGVAVPTVDASAKSKRDILKGILDLSISGDDEQVPIQASARWQEIEAEPNPRTTLRKLARLHREICVREAPAFAIMADAAGSDPEIRSLMHDMADQRYQDHHRLAKTLYRRPTSGPVSPRAVPPTSPGLSPTSGPTSPSCTIGDDRR